MQNKRLKITFRYLKSAKLKYENLRQINEENINKENDK